MRIASCLVFASAILTALFAAGCSQDPVATKMAQLNDSNIKKLANLYASYRMFNETKGPPDEQAFKQFISSELPAERAQMMSIDQKNADAMFVSERDAKPFKIKYGVAGGILSLDPVIFEEEGVGGKRQVGFLGQPTIEEVDDARYKQLWEKGGAPIGVSTSQETKNSSK